MSKFDHLFSLREVGKKNEVSWDQKRQRWVTRVWRKFGVLFILYENVFPPSTKTVLPVVCHLELKTAFLNSGVSSPMMGGIGSS